MECLSLGIKTIKTIFYYYNLTKKQKEHIYEIYLFKFRFYKYALFMLYTYIYNIN